MDKKKYCTENKPFAYHSSFGGIEIYEIFDGIEDRILFTANAWHGNVTYHIRKLHYTEYGAYFTFMGTRILLKDCIRIDPT